MSIPAINGLLRLVRTEQDQMGRVPYLYARREEFPLKREERAHLKCDCQWGLRHTDLTVVQHGFPGATPIG